MAARVAASWICQAGVGHSGLLRKALLLLLLGLVLTGWSWFQAEFPPASADGHFRVAAWNIRRFPETGTDATRVAEILANLDADLVAVEEIRDRPAFEQLIQAVNGQVAGRSYNFELSDEGGAGNQRIGFIFDTNAAQLSDVTDLESLRMSSGIRPGFYARVRSLRPGGLDFHIIANHTDSGRDLRDYRHRQMFLGALRTEVVRLRASDRDIIVLGDLNTMGRSAVDGAVAVTSEDEIAILDAEMSIMGMRRLRASIGCSESFFPSGSDNSGASLLDHILVSSTFLELPGGTVTGVYGYCSTTACARFTRTTAPSDFDEASDHCPIVIDLVDRDLD